jgi:tRNA pseudouridine55 synthase
MDGILNFNKPPDWTSHDAVARVRRLIGQKRVGHAGTLDPLATGVLLICIGQATRVAEYLMASDKIYLARIKLGVTTDTFDSTGQVTGTYTVNIDEAAIRAVLTQFTGNISQVPPMHSALKHQGQPLYKLARRGVEIERAPRQVTIGEIALQELRLPELTISVTCSSGTYIRSLAHDIGQTLGCGAHMTALTRLVSGVFSIEQAVTPDALEATANTGHFSALLHPIDAALHALPAVTLDADTIRRVRFGQAVQLSITPSPTCRAYDASGELAAIMVYRSETGDWQPDKVFT